MQMSFSALPRSDLLGAGVFLLVVVGLIIGAIHPYRHALGSLPAALPDVEVLQVQQEDVPVIHEGIGTLDGLVNEIQASPASLGDRFPRQPRTGTRRRPPNFATVRVGHGISRAFSSIALLSIHPSPSASLLCQK